MPGGYSLRDILIEELEKLRRRLEEEIKRLHGVGAERESWSPHGFLEPLYHVYEYPDHYSILIDMAGADTANMEVGVVDDRLVVECKLSREVSYSDLYGTVVGRDIRFTKYRHVIPLPPDADAENIEVKVHPGKIVEIIIPKRGPGGRGRSGEGSG